MEIEEKIRQNLDKLSSEERVQVFQYLIREKSKKSLYFLCTKVLGLDKFYSPLHKPLCEFVQNQDIKRKLVLWPRFHGKTNICTMAYTIWLLINNPEATILILSATQDMGRAFLGQIRQQFMQNRLLHTVFPEMCPQEGSDFGSKDGFNILNKTQITKEMSVQCGAIDMNLTGLHFDFIIKDDLVTKDNATTQELCQKVIEANNLSYALMNPGAKEIMVGTRYSFGDLYGHIVEDKKGLYELNFQTLRNEEGKLVSIWPNHFPLGEVEAKLAEMGSAQFAAQMENNPIDPEAIIFRPELVKEIEREFLPTLNKFTFVDPAISEAKTSDFSAIAEMGIDRWGNVYLLDLVRAKLQPEALINELIQFKKIHDPVFTGIESNVFQRIILPYSQKIAGDLNTLLNVKEIKKPNKITKYQHIVSLQPLVEQGKFFIVTNCRNKQFFLNELRRYPKTQHDDCIDAVAYITQFYNVRPSEEGEDKKVYSPRDGKFFERLLDYQRGTTEVMGNDGIPMWNLDYEEALRYASGIDS